MKHETEGEEKSEDYVIGEKTPIRLGIVVGLVGAIVTMIGCAFYLGGKLTGLETKVDAMAINISQASKDGQQIASDMKRHEASDSAMWNEVKSRVQLLEQSGSQATRDLAKDVNSLRIDFEVWKATAKKEGKQ